jgi:hypothetical protein
MKMNLQNWLNEGRLQRHNTSTKEIADLLKVVDRDLADAAIKEISADRRFATAYNAALQLATIVLYASGYRTGKSGHHWVTFKILPEVMGPEAIKKRGAQGTEVEEGKPVCTSTNGAWLSRVKKNFLGSMVSRGLHPL